MAQQVFVCKRRRLPGCCYLRRQPLIAPALSLPPQTPSLQVTVAGPRTILVLQGRGLRLGHAPRAPTARNLVRPSLCCHHHRTRMLRNVQLPSEGMPGRGWLRGQSASVAQSQPSRARSLATDAAEHLLRHCASSGSAPAGDANYSAATGAPPQAATARHPSTTADAA